MNLFELTESEPYKLWSKAFSALCKWDEFEERTAKLKKRNPESIVTETMLHHQLETSFRLLAVMGRAWNMDVRPLEEFNASLINPGYQLDRSRLRRFLEQYQDEAEARWLKSKGNDKAVARHLLGLDSPTVEEALEEIEGEHNKTKLSDKRESPLAYIELIPPNRVTFRKKETETQPKPWHLLRFLREGGRLSIASDKVIDAVWGHDSDAGESDGPLKSAIKKANRALQEVSYPGTVTNKNGFVSLS